MSMSSWFRNVGLAFVAAATLSCGDDLGTPKPDGGSDGGKVGDGGGSSGAAEAGGKIDSAASDAGTEDAERAPDATVDATPLVVDTAKDDRGQAAAIDARASGGDADVDAPAEIDVQGDVGVYLDLRSGDGSIGS